LFNITLLKINTTTSLLFKLLKQELNLIFFSVQSILGLTRNKTFNTNIAHFLTKKNYFLRDFIFF
jgi:hypothetical protein